MKKQEESKQELVQIVPHVVFHMEGESGDGELVTVAQESHSFGETATIGQLFGRARAMADKLSTIRVDQVFVEIGMCDGGDGNESASTDRSPEVTHIQLPSEAE